MRQIKVLNVEIFLTMMRREEAFWGVGTTFGRLIWATFAPISPPLPVHTPTHYSSARCTLAAYLDKIDCYWAFFLRLFISLDRFILFVIRSHCARSSGAADGGGVHSNDLHEKRFLSKNRRKCRVREFFGKLQNTDLLTTYVAWKASHSWGLHVMCISPVWELHQYD